MAKSNMRRRNEGDAKNLALAARNSEISMARMRDDAVWGMRWEMGRGGIGCELDMRPMIKEKI